MALVLKEDYMMTADSLYEKWLLINKMCPGDRLTPTVEIDEIWHRRLSNPTAYIRECLAVAGFPLIHDLNCDRRGIFEGFDRLRTLWAFHHNEELLGMPANCTRAPHHD